MLAVHLLVQRADDSRKEDRLFFIGNDIFLEELNWLSWPCELTWPCDVSWPCDD